MSLQAAPPRGWQCPGAALADYALAEPSSTRGEAAARAARLGSRRGHQAGALSSQRTGRDWEVRAPTSIIFLRGVGRWDGGWRERGRGRQAEQQLRSPEGRVLEPGGGRSPHPPPPAARVGAWPPRKSSRAFSASTQGAGARTRSCGAALPLLPPPSPNTERGWLGPASPGGLSSRLHKPQAPRRRLRAHRGRAQKD